jgi:hypothetical protein
VEALDAVSIGFSVDSIIAFNGKHILQLAGQEIEKPTLLCEYTRWISAAGGQKETFRRLGYVQPGSSKAPLPPARTLSVTFTAVSEVWQQGLLPLVSRSLWEWTNVLMPHSLGRYGARLVIGVRGERC